MPGKREYPEHPLVGVGGLIHRDGKILLIRRKFEPNKGRWSLPGGLMEIGEDPESAATREVREELGIQVAVDGLFQVANEVIRDDDGRVRYHFVLVDYIMVPTAGEITLNEESDAYEWFAPEAIEGLNASRNTLMIARKYAQKMREKSLR